MVTVAQTMWKNRMKRVNLLFAISVNLTKEITADIFKTCSGWTFVTQFGLGTCTLRSIEIEQYSLLNLWKQGSHCNWFIMLVGAGGSVNVYGCHSLSYRNQTDVILMRNTSERAVLSGLIRADESVTSYFDALRCERSWQSWNMQCWRRYARLLLLNLTQ